MKETRMTINYKTRVPTVSFFLDRIFRVVFVRTKCNFPVQSKRELNDRHKIGPRNPFSTQSPVRIQETRRQCPLKV